MFFIVPKGLSFVNAALTIIRAKSNRLPDLLPHVPAILAALRSIERGQTVQVG
jgi:hypothetical protein